MYPSDFFVKNGFTQLIKIAVPFLAQIGTKNYLQQRPKILFAACEEDDHVVGTVTASNMIIQNFQTNRDNINSFYFTAASGKAQTELDDLDIATYANDAALQAVWIKGGTDSAVRELTIVAPGSDMSMKLDCSKSDGDWYALLSALPISSSPVDFSKGIMSLKFRQTVEFSQLKINFYIKDGLGNKSSVLLVVQNGDINKWLTLNLPINSFTSDTPADVEDIVGIGFEVVDKENNGFVYVDDVSYKISTGSIRIKLWDWGSNKPIAGSSKLDDATQYNDLGDIVIHGEVKSQIDIELLPGKRLYHMHDFVAGTAFESGDNKPLVPYNWYGISWEYIDEDVIIYGDDSGKLDGIGYSAYAPNASTALTITGPGENVQFYACCVVPVYIADYHLHFLDAGGSAATSGKNTDWSSLVEDKDKRPIIIDHHHHHDLSDYSFEYLALSPIFMDLGGKFETKFIHGGNDDIVGIMQEVVYMCKPINVLI